MIIVFQINIPKSNHTFDQYNRTSKHLYNRTGLQNKDLIIENSNNIVLFF